MKKTKPMGSGSGSGSVQNRAMRAVSQGKPIQASLMDAMLLYGSAAFEANEHLKARLLIQAVLTEDDTHPQAHLVYAAVLRVEGDLTGARRHLALAARYERDPAIPSAHKVHMPWVFLSEYARLEPGKPGLLDAVLEAASRQVPPEAEEAVSFALATVLDYHGRHEEAYAAFGRMNRARASAAPWPGMDTQTLAYIHENAPWCDNDGKHDEAGPHRVFIVGLPRTGTTLVETVLLAHPEAYSVGEDGAIADAFAKQYAPSAYLDVAKRIDAEDLDRAARDWRRGAGTVERPTVIINKMPDNWNYVGLIRLLYGPRATVVHCERNPADAVWSNYTTSFADPAMSWTTDWKQIANFVRFYRQTAACWDRLLPGWSALNFDLDAATCSPASWPIWVTLLWKRVYGKETPIPAVAFSVARRGPVATASTLQVRQGVQTGRASRAALYEPWFPDEIRALIEARNARDDAGPPL